MLSNCEFTVLNCIRSKDRIIVPERFSEVFKTLNFFFYQRVTTWPLLESASSRRSRWVRPFVQSYLQQTLSESQCWAVPCCRVGPARTVFSCMAEGSHEVSREAMMASQLWRLSGQHARLNVIYSLQVDDFCLSLAKDVSWAIVEIHPLRLSHELEVCHERVKIPLLFLISGGEAGVYILPSEDWGAADANKGRGNNVLGMALSDPDTSCSSLQRLSLVMCKDRIEGRINVFKFG